MVPLACRVYYRGFTALITSNLELESRGKLAFGQDGDNFESIPEIVPDMKQIGKILKILPHPLKSQTSGSNIEISISQFLKVYKVPLFSKKEVIDQHTGRSTIISKGRKPC